MERDRGRDQHQAEAEVQVTTYLLLITLLTGSPCPVVLQFETLSDCTITGLMLYQSKAKANGSDIKGWECRKGKIGGTQNDH